ncbi:MAG: hypothetical protein AAF078_13825, partial [Planctomycetota bacterium]
VVHLPIQPGDVVRRADLPLPRVEHDARHEAANLRSRIEAQAAPAAVAEAVEAVELPLMPAAPDAPPPAVAQAGGLVD